MGKIVTFAKYNWGIILGMAWFLIFFVFNLHSLPYLDANFDYIKSLTFFHEGMTGLIHNYGSIMHPPMKDLLLFGTYKLGFDFVLSFHAFVLPFAVLGIVSAKRIAAYIFNDNRSGNVAAATLGLLPLFVTVGTQNLNDFLVCCLQLFALSSYLNKAYFQLAVGLTLAVLFKETALIMLPILLIYESYQFIKHHQPLNLVQTGISLMVPALFFGGWSLFLKQKGLGIWQHYVFASSAGNGALGTVIQRTLALDFNNPYFLENSKHLLVLNFNWLLFALALISVILIYPKTQSKKGFLLLIYFLGHLVVLNFPTYTIPRYILPVLVVPVMLAAGLLAKIKSNVVLLGLLIGFAIVSGFRSIDPVSNWVWKDPQMFGRFWVFYQTLYDLNAKISGNDRITYNLQYLFVLQQRTRALQALPKGSSKIYSPDCLWLFRDPTNDLFTLQNQKLFSGHLLPECERKI